MRERGAARREVMETVTTGAASPAKFGRQRFRKVFVFNAVWNGKRYARKQLDVFAVRIPNGWLVVTVIARYF
jgi:hypothetical protein